MKFNKILSLCLVALMMVAFNSCKKDTVDVTDLLKTVPSSAGGVIVLNVEGLAEDAGCKIKDHVIQAGPEIKSLLEKASTGARRDFSMLFDGTTGIEPKGAVVFYDANRAFLTVALYDVDKFYSFVEKQTGSTFEDAGSGVKVCGQVAVKGAQAWVCLPTGKRLDPDAIAAYASLNASQSFLVTPLGEELLTDESDIRGWTMLDTYMSQMLDRRNRTMFSLGLGFLFEKGESVKFKADCKKGEFEAEAEILNDKGKPAKFKLPMDKVDVDAIKSLGTTCQGMMAFTLSPKLVKKFEEIGNAFGGALFGNVSDELKNVDGTVAVIASGKNDATECLSGLITTKGNVSQNLKDFISEYLGSINEDGKTLRFSKGTVSGNLNVEECAEELKGSCFGIIADATEVNNMGVGPSLTSGFKCIELKLKPSSGSLEIEFEAKTQDEKENALLTYLKSL